MKTIIFTALAALCTISATAQINESDKQVIEKQVDAFMNSWNEHDFSDLKRYTTPDLDWVNVVGMYWKNREEVQFAHQYFHDRMFKTVSLTKNWVKIRFVTPEVAIAHVNMHADGYTTPSGMNIPAGDNISTMVFVKKDNQWLLCACENVNVDDHAKNSDPVLYMTHH